LRRTAKKPYLARWQSLLVVKVAEVRVGAFKRPVLAGGLLKSLEDISSILAAGAAGVSTSHQKLWRAP